MSLRRYPYATSRTVRARRADVRAVRERRTGPRTGRPYGSVRGTGARSYGVRVRGAVRTGAGAVRTRLPRTARTRTEAVHRTRAADPYGRPVRERSHHTVRGVRRTWPSTRAGRTDRVRPYGPYATPRPDTVRQPPYGPACTAARARAEPYGGTDPYGGRSMGRAVRRPRTGVLGRAGWCTGPYGPYGSVRGPWRTGCCVRVRTLVPRTGGPYGVRVRRTERHASWPLRVVHLRAHRYTGGRQFRGSHDEPAGHQNTTHHG